MRTPRSATERVPRGSSARSHMSFGDDSGTLVIPNDLTRGGTSLVHKSRGPSRPPRAACRADLVEIEVDQVDRLPLPAIHQRSEGVAQAGETLGALPQPLPVRGHVREDGGMAIEVAALEEQPRLLGSVDPGEERSSGRTPFLPALHEVQGRATGTGLIPAR